MDINSVNKVYPSHESDDALGKRRTSQMFKRLRIEAQRKHQKEVDDNQLEQLVDASLFENQDSIEFDKHATASKEFDNYVSVTASNVEISEAELMAEQNRFKDIFTSKYIPPEQIELLLEHYELSKENKHEVSNLIDQMVDAPEGAELALLNNMLQKTQMNKAQLYLVLNFIMERLRRRKVKEKFLKQLEKWAMLYENQESGYLSEFFALANNKELLNKINEKFNVDAMANLNSGGVSISGIKQTIQLVAELFDNKFTNMVSMFMKLRANQLELVTHAARNPETKAKLHEMLSLEKNLIVVHSTYLQHAEFKKFLAKLIKNNPDKCESWLQDKQNTILTATLNFCETNFISDLTVDKLLREWQLSDVLKSSSANFLYDLILFVHKLPVALFKDNAANIQKITEGVRNILREKSPDTSVVASNAPVVSFLNKKRKTIEYV
jgi:hypothetical protein